MKTLDERLADAVMQVNLEAQVNKLFDDPRSEESSFKLTDELRLARYLRAKHDRNGVSTLHFYLGDWYEWAGRWRRLDAQEFADRLYRLCKQYLLIETAKLPPDAKGNDPKAPTFGKAQANNVEMALRSIVSLKGRKPPCWDDNRPGRYIAFSDSILSLEDFLGGEVVCFPQTPEYFSPHALDYPCEYTDAEPEVLLAALREQMSQSEIDALQEFGGYCMTPDTDFQRGVYLTGPPRSLKGTFERTTRATVGEHNCASKTLKAFQSPHALEDLPGKMFLSLSDQRGSDKVSAEALERLLGIIGQDVQSINPKGRPHYSAALDCKIMIVSNLVLNFDDDTGAAAARFLFIKTRKSFAGQEDPTLLKRILAERNQVTWWFLRGLRRLLTNGRYTEPQNNLRQEFEHHNSPVKAFVAERCELDGEIGKDALYQAFLTWCEDRQIAEIDSNIFFRKLYGSFKGVALKRSRAGAARANNVRGIRLKAPC